MSSIFLFSEQSAHYYRELIHLVNRAIAAAPNMTHDEYLAFLADKNRLQEALESAGINPRAEANYLSKKLKNRYFCIDFLINNEFVLLLNDSQSQSPQFINDIPGIDALAMEMNIATTRKEQAAILCDIRRILSDRKLLSMDAYYLPADLWEISSTNAILSIFANTPEDKEESDRRKLAEIIADTNGMQLAFTRKNYQFAFTGVKNKFAYIATSNGSIIGETTSDPLNENLLQQMFTVILKKAIITASGGNITVKLSKFCQEMGIDPTLTEKHNGSDFTEKLRTLEKYTGIMGEDRYRVLSMLKFEPSKDTITFASPYIEELIRRYNDDGIIEKKTKTGNTYKLPGFAMTTRATITHERNAAAREILNRITVGLMQRGSKSNNELKQNANTQNADNKVVYTITFRSLISKCPTLYAQLANQTQAKAKNTYLKRAFTTAYKLIRTQSTLYDYFTNLCIDENNIPTSKTLDSNLVITHEGRNAKYKGKSPIPASFSI